MYSMILPKRLKGRQEAAILNAEGGLKRVIIDTTPVGDALLVTVDANELPDAPIRPRLGGRRVTIPRDLGAVVRNHCEVFGVTAKKLGAQAGLGPGTINHMIDGKRTSCLSETLDKLMAVLAGADEPTESPTSDPDGPQAAFPDQTPRQTTPADGLAP